jgi:hypothetical protein
MTKAKPTMKSLDDIKLDMSVLYDEVNNGNTELKTAAELANIAGKYLKAEQLQLAREIFLGQLGKKGESLQAQLTASA